MALFFVGETCSMVIVPNLKFLLSWEFFPNKLDIKSSVLGFWLFFVLFFNYVNFQLSRFLVYKNYVFS